jgi:hypothetical protein
MPVCVHEGGAYASAGTASVAIKANAAKVEHCFNINITLKSRSRVIPAASEASSVTSRFPIGHFALSKLNEELFVRYADSAGAVDLT